MRTTVRSASSSWPDRLVPSPALALFDGRSGDAALADNAYDSNALRAIIAGIGATAVIPLNRTRRITISRDTDALQQRNRIQGTLPALRYPF